MIGFTSLRLDYPGAAIGGQQSSLSAKHATEPERLRIHQQAVLRINGSQSNGSKADGIILEVSLFIRGARWRTSLHRLCTALEPDPQTEGRGCAAPGAAFEAAVYVLVPGLRPRFRPQRRRGRRTMLKDARSEADRVLLAAKELASINVCAPHLRLPAPLLRAVSCTSWNSSRRPEAAGATTAAASSASSPGFASPLLLREAPLFRRHVFSQSSADEWRAVGAAALLALVTLPRPFTLVEVRRGPPLLTLWYADGILTARWHTRRARVRTCARATNVHLHYTCTQAGGLCGGMTVPPQKVERRACGGPRPWAGHGLR